MPNYTFTFKKDDVFVEFTTEDREVVERQFQIWVASADDYANNRPQRTVTTVPKASPIKIDEPQEVSAIIAQETTIKETDTEIQPEFEQQIKEEKPTEQVIEQYHEQPIEQTTEQIPEQPEVFDKASSLLKTINTIQNPPIEEETQVPNVNFEDVLEKTIENPNFEPNRVNDQVFLNLFKSKNTTDKFHYLMITAYYLSEFEKMERFSLKQINSKLMTNLSEVIDHSTLQEAINQNLIELVPDLTGTAEVDEYRITRNGEEFFANKI